MGNEQELRDRIAALEAEVAELRRKLSMNDRLGPRPDTQAEIDARTQRLVDAVKQAQHEHEQDAGGRQICTTSGEAPSKVRAEQKEPAGQHKSYIVLCEEERAKGFVRPYRDSYRHVGPDICGLQVGPGGETVCFMDPKHDGECGTAKGPRPQACQTVTRMGRALSETYARDPKFYGATFCCGCDRHLPVAEFVWTVDRQRVGS